MQKQPRTFTLGLLKIKVFWIKGYAAIKIKVFWIKGYDAITSFHEVTKTNLSRDSNYTLYMVMLSKFGNSNKSMREIIITSIL